jgi:ferredoxin-NADP reductase
MTSRVLDLTSQTAFPKAGQFFFLTIRKNGKELQKHFSFSSSPTEGGYIEFTKKLTGHEFSNALDELKEGDWARLKGPFGEFTYQGEYEKLGMLVGGIGITAIRSICRLCTDRYPTTNIILLYGNRTEKDIVFKDDLEQMQKHNTNLKMVHSLSTPSEGWLGYTGYIDRKIAEKEIPDYLDRTFYSCGSPSLVEAMKKILEELRVPKSQIITENFPGH